MKTRKSTEINGMSKETRETSNRILQTNEATIKQVMKSLEKKKKSFQSVTESAKVIRESLK